MTTVNSVVTGLYFFVVCKIVVHLIPDGIVDLMRSSSVSGSDNCSEEKK